MTNAMTLADQVDRLVAENQHLRVKKPAPMPAIPSWTCKWTVTAH